MSFLSKVPWQVWAAIAGVIAVLYYGHVREKRGFERCHTQVVEATKKEEARRVEAANESAAEAKTRAAESQNRADALKGELDAKLDEIRKLKESKTACVPGTITDRYQRGRVQSPSRVPSGTR